ncbi:MAG TPA: hypothetical protein ENJ91_10920 [Rhodobacteraceae bacterium]|nr:hypothetical protein [Paracoccaceae bacterium]
MIDPESHEKLGEEISMRIMEDRDLLNELRTEIHPLKDQVRRIHSRTTTSISLVGTDGGNNKIEYNPFLIQLIRVVDSSNNEYCLEAISTSSRIRELNKQHIKDGQPLTAMGELMAFLNVDSLHQLSPMIRLNEGDDMASPSWVQVYREITEWAILFNIIRKKEFGSDTLIVFDGLLRSKVFTGDLFRRLLNGIEEAITSHRRKTRRRIYLVGLAKHSKVLARYRLAMQLENVMNVPYPCYVEIPRDIEARSYAWQEYARGADLEIEGQEINKFVGGKMFFVKFGKSIHDPIWPVDIFVPQANEAPAIMGYLLADAENGFPVPFYPLCLQKAHENAALVDFDFDVLQDQIFEGIRKLLGDDSTVLDIARFQNTDPSQRRY